MEKEGFEKEAELWRQKCRAYDVVADVEKNFEKFDDALAREMVQELAKLAPGVGMIGWDGWMHLRPLLLTRRCVPPHRPAMPPMSLRSSSIRCTPPHQRQPPPLQRLRLQSLHQSEEGRWSRQNAAKRYCSYVGVVC